MTTIKPGELWLADILFTDGSSVKRRPVLVLWLDGEDAVVAAVTSAAPRTTTDVPIDQWEESGLRLPSTVRLSRLDCLEQSLLKRRLGRLRSTDAKTIQNTWQKHIKPNF